MIASFDWLLAAKHHKTWRLEILHALDSAEKKEITRGEMYRLVFCPDEQFVYVSAYSDDSALSWKIVPMKIPYKSVLGFLEDDNYQFIEDAIEC